MKKGAFSALLYREWVLVKKPLIVTFIVSLSTVILTFLIVLSFKYGNLAMLDEKLRAAVFGDSALVVRAMPAFTVSLLAGASSDSAVIDANIKWDRFRRTTPASCLRLAIAKYTIVTALTIIATGGTLGVTALMCYVMDAEFTASDAAFSLVLLAIAVIFSVTMQVAVAYFRSVDKAGMAAMGVMAACMIPVIVANRDFFSIDNAAMSSTERLNILTKKFADILPCVPFVIAAALAVGLFATTMIYKRREK